MSEVDWSQFDDWLEYGGTGGDWPSSEENKELTEAQKEVVDRNAELLLVREAWQGRVEAFEEALANIKDKEKREEKLSEFCIHFDAYEFDRKSHPDLSFFRYKFPCTVSFKSVKFGDGGVSFYSSKFVAMFIFFDGSNFGEGDVSFNQTQFGNGDVFFRSTQFGDGVINFSFARVGNGSMIFSHALLSDNTKFDALDMIVEGNLILRTAFFNSVKFVGLKVNGFFAVSGSKFTKCLDFRGADFGRPPEVAGLKLPPPNMKGDKLFYFFKTGSDADDASKYRKLNAMAKAANDHDKELEFFAYEMMAKRGHEITGFWELLANSFYYHVSYYGQSWMRPLIGMGISCFVFFWLYFIYAMSSMKCLENAWFSIKYSMLNTLPFVSALYRSSIQPKDYESGLMVDLDKLATVDGEMMNGSLGGLMFLSFCQQFIGIVLLFFLLLGLRNRFRLK